MLWYKLKTGFLAVIVIISRSFVILFEYLKKFSLKLKDYIENRNANKNR